MEHQGNEERALTHDQINDRFNEGSERMAAIEHDLIELRHAAKELQELKCQLVELIEFFTAMKGAFKVLNWLGKLAKPVAYIVMLGSAFLGLWKAYAGTIR